MKNWLPLVLLLGCSHTQTVSEACDGSFQCLHRWDTCYAYCSEPTTAPDGSKTCLQYDRPHEDRCPLCEPLTGVSERQVAIRDARNNCGDDNAERQLSRHNGGILPCDYKP